MNSRARASVLAFSALALLACAGCAASAQPPPPLSSDAAIAAAERAELPRDWADWNHAFAPFNVIGDIYYVGPRGIGIYLITTPAGHILLDGGFAQSAPQVEANIQALGFRVSDIKFLLNTHAHIDHAGGLARLKRDSGAMMLASAGDAPALEAGRVSAGPTAEMPYPAVRVDRIMGDGESVRLGGVTLTAHMTPGHTPGCTSWTMTTRDASGAARSVFFTCSETVAGQSLAPESYPGVVEAYRATFARVATMQADVFLGPHGNFFDLEGKRARQLAGDANAFVDPTELQRFNVEMQRQFEQELARQQAARR
ncbi:MAG TPA: subclass B3 metallo-beta-lactamase [Caulobacterales bacterium]|nr:subclass B3 metallo-beta-lactamase [Caulobacterales bacterium]